MAYRLTRIQSIDQIDEIHSGGLRSSINLFMHGYTNEATDLSVKVPGGSIDIQRASTKPWKTIRRNHANSADYQYDLFKRLKR